MSDIVIKAENLEKQYMKQKAVKKASFEIREGMICGLVGPNGAGKTTIMKMMGGLILPTAGSLSIYDGKTNDELARSRSRMSFMIEIPYAKEGMKISKNSVYKRVSPIKNVSMRSLKQSDLRMWERSLSVNFHSV